MVATWDCLWHRVETEAAMILRGCSSTSDFSGSRQTIRLAVTCTPSTSCCCPSSRYWSSGFRMPPNWPASRTEAKKLPMLVAKYVVVLESRALFNVFLFHLGECVLGLVEIGSTIARGKSCCCHQHLSEQNIECG